jgi:hypothetical protein
MVALEVADVEAFVQVWSGLLGRLLNDRAALARAFVAKAVTGMSTTSMSIARRIASAPMVRVPTAWSDFCFAIARASPPRCWPCSTGGRTPISDL